MTPCTPQPPPRAPHPLRPGSASLPLTPTALSPPLPLPLLHPPPPSPAPLLNVAPPRPLLPPSASARVTAAAAGAGRTIEDLFAVAEGTGNRRLLCNVMRELHAGDQTWEQHLPTIMSQEDDHSVMKLTLSDMLAIDISGITDPNQR